MEALLLLGHSALIAKLSPDNLLHEVDASFINISIPWQKFNLTTMFINKF